MYLTIPGLVLRVTDYNDTDALLTLLTSRHGKLTVKARGLRRKNSVLSGCCQLLAYGEFTLFEYKGMYTINEATSIALFPELRRDLCKLSLGTYFAQVAELISQEDLPNPELLSLVLNCLHALAAGSEGEEKVKAVFELRTACLAGYMPDLVGCHTCGSQTPDRFDLSGGRLECHSCHAGGEKGIRMPVNTAIIQAMQFICMCDGKKILSFRLGRENLIRLAQLTEAYLTTQLERGFSSLDFYKSLLESPV